VLSVYIVLFTQMLDSSIANLSLIHISSDLHMDVFHASWIMTFYGAGLVVAFPFAPYFAKHMSSDSVFLWGGVVFIVSSVGCAFAGSSELFLLFRFIQGFSAGLGAVVCQGLMIRVMGEKNKTFTIALITSAISLAPVFGPFLGGLINEFLDWRWLFLVNVPLMSLSLFFLLDTLQLDAPEKMPSKPGYLVALFSFALFILCSQYVFDFGREKGWFNSLEIQTACVLCALFFVIFVHFNRQPGCSVFDLTLLRSKDYMITTVILGLGNGVIFSSLVLLPLWLQIDYGMPLLQAGGIVAVASAVAAVLAPVVGKKVDAKAYPALSLLSLSLTGYSFYMMSQFTLDTSQFEIVITRLVAGLGLATFTAPLLSLSLAKVGMDKMNEANSLSLSFRLVASNIGVAVAFSYWQYEHIRLKEQVIADMDKFSYQGVSENKLHWMNTMFEKVTHSMALTNILHLYAIIFFAAAVVMATLFAYQNHLSKSGNITPCQTS